MDQFPSEILTKIFSYLDFETLVNLNCNVCKRWRKIVHENNVKLKTIVVNEDRTNPFVLQLFKTDQIVDHRDVLTVHSTSYIERRASLASVWKNIRKLIIFNCDLDLNQFELLEHLETHCTKVIDLKRAPQTVRISLKKLKILVLLLELSVCTYYVLDTPELQSLRTANIEHFEMPYRGTLVNLECYLYSDCIKRFKNLRQLICNRIDIYDGKLLKRLPKLEEFQVNCIGKGDLNALLGEKEDLGRAQLKIIVKSIIIRSKEYPAVLLNNDFEIFSSSNKQLFLENYDSLSSNLHFISDFFVDFDITVLPHCIYSKLKSLKSIVVHHAVEDEISWTHLLQASRLIHTIKIFHPVEQYFVDLIALYCPNLSTLSIQKADIGDFEFVRKFQNLERFSSDQEIAIDEFRRLVQVLKSNAFLKFIVFKFKKIDFKLEILGDDVYCEYYKCILIQKLDRLIETLNQTCAWPELILQMKSINEFEKDSFRGKLFRLCYKFRNFGLCDQPLSRVMEGYGLK